MNTNTQANHNHIFETMPPTRLFVKCAIPSMLSMAMMSLYTIVDGIFVGQFIGENALVAVNLVMPLILISFALSDMIAVGSSVQIAIKLGQKKPKEAGGILSLCILLILGISIVMGFAAFFFADSVVSMMGADEEIKKLALEYIKVFAIFSPLIMLSFALDNYLRICGKVNYSLGVNIATGVCNILLDWLLIGKLGFGIWSAAFATCISLVLCTVLSLAPIVLGRLELKLSKPTGSLKLVGNVIANGSSELFSNIAGSILMALINIVLLRISGSTAVAAFSIIMYIDSIIKPMLYGMADSMQPSISYNYGSGSMKRVWAIERRVLVTASILSSMLFLFMELQGHHLIGLFSQKDNVELFNMAKEGMQIFAFSYLFSWFAITISSFFTALNRPVYSLVLAFCNAMIFPIGLLLILCPAFGLLGVWLTPVCEGILAFILSGTLLLKVRNSSKKEQLAKNLAAIQKETLE